MIVYRTFRFHAARYLPNLDDSHICKNMHGHTFNLTVHVKGNIDKKIGFVIDFFDIDKIVNSRIINIIDHKILNDIDGLNNPTSEYLCKWIWENLNKEIDDLYKIVLSEDYGTGIIYKGE
tara:strand:+ start:60 stop:419 length:360 start_codon:yes stop_codon:yes gene_type:complete